MKKLTKQQANIISAYTGVSCGNFNDFHEYITKLLGRDVYTHELAKPHLWDLIKEKSKADFLSICCDEN